MKAKTIVVVHIVLSQTFLAIADFEATTRAVSIDSDAPSLAGGLSFGAPPPNDYFFGGLCLSGTAGHQARACTTVRCSF